MQLATTALKREGCQAVKRWQCLMIRQRWQLRMRTPAKIRSTNSYSRLRICTDDKAEPLLGYLSISYSVQTCTMKCSSQLGSRELSRRTAARIRLIMDLPQIFVSPDSSCVREHGSTSLLNSSFTWLLSFSSTTPPPSYSCPCFTSCRSLALASTRSLSPSRSTVVCLAHSLLSTTLLKSPALAFQVDSTVQMSSKYLQTSSCWPDWPSLMMCGKGGKRVFSRAATLSLCVTLPIWLKRLTAFSKLLPSTYVRAMTESCSSDKTNYAAYSQHICLLFCSRVLQVTPSKTPLSLDMSYSAMRAPPSKISLISLMFFCDCSLSLSNTQLAKSTTNWNRLTRCSTATWLLLSSAEKQVSRRHLPQKTCQTPIGIFSTPPHPHSPLHSSWYANLSTSMGISSQISDSSDTPSTQGCHAGRLMNRLQQFRPNSKVCIDSCDPNTRLMFCIPRKTSSSRVPLTPQQERSRSLFCSCWRREASQRDSSCWLETRRCRYLRMQPARISLQSQWEWTSQRSEFSSYPPQKQCQVNRFRNRSHISPDACDQESLLQSSLSVDLLGTKPHLQKFQAIRMNFSRLWEFHCEQSASAQMLARKESKQRKARVARGSQAADQLVRTSVIRYRRAAGSRVQKFCRYFASAYSAKASPYSNQQISSFAGWAQKMLKVLVMMCWMCDCLSSAWTSFCTNSRISSRLAQNCRLPKPAILASTMGLSSARCSFLLFLRQKLMELRVTCLLSAFLSRKAWNSASGVWEDRIWSTSSHPRSRHALCRPYSLRLVSQSRAQSSQDAVSTPLLLSSSTFFRQLRQWQSGSYQLRQLRILKVKKMIRASLLLWLLCEFAEGATCFCASAFLQFTLKEAVESQEKPQMLNSLETSWVLGVYISALNSVRTCLAILRLTSQQMASSSIALRELGDKLRSYFWQYFSISLSSDTDLRSPSTYSCSKPRLPQNSFQSLKPMRQNCIFFIIFSPIARLQLTYRKSPPLFHSSRLSKPKFCTF